jgi:hypothetical protein
LGLLAVHGVFKSGLQSPLAVEFLLIFIPHNIRHQKTLAARGIFGFLGANADTKKPQTPKLT